MPAHDIIDNRREKLSAHIRQILGSTEAAKFAVGYFFLSGFDAIADTLDTVKELRLLIGNTTNQQTLDQLTEGYRRLELVAERVEEQTYTKRTESAERVRVTAANVRNSVELMDQTDKDERVIRTLAQMVENGRLQVKVYTKGRLHAKAYIFDYCVLYDQEGKAVDRHEKGIAIIGSSNLTLSGITDNTELNVVVQGNDNHAELTRWFDELWDEALDFSEPLMHEMQRSWALAQVRPYDIYMKTLYELVRDRLDGGEDQETLWDDEITEKLADFQKVAVKVAIQMIRDWGGAFVADVVGLGKSYVGAAIVKHFRRIANSKPLIICPAALVEMWERYNAVFDLGAVVLSMGLLKEQEDEDGTKRNLLLDDVRYSDRDFVLIDESHHFRYHDRQRYRLLQSFMASGRLCCFLTATPRNKTAWDIYHQIKLFHPDDKTDLPIDPPDLREFFKAVDDGEEELRVLLTHLLYRRKRNDVLKWYGRDAETHEPVDPTRFDEYRSGKRRAYVTVGGRHQFFPKRELETVEYNIEDTYQGLYQQLRAFMGRARKGLPKEPLAEELTYARYGLWHYVLPEKQGEEPYVSLHRAGVNLRGLIRVLLFKRFESSVHAYRQTVDRLRTIHRLFLQALKENIVPAGEDAQQLLYESDELEQAELLDALQAVCKRYSADDFDLELLRRHIEHDIRVLDKMHAIVEPITAKQDAKLQELKRRLGSKPLNGSKCLIFTQYADTARYLYENLNPGERRDDIDVIYSGGKSKSRVVGRFAPKANPQLARGAGKETRLLIATDVLAEGLNLQDGDTIINYDLHWNPVRLIQRFGRIDRIGTEHDVVHGFNFLPETALEHELGLTETLANRIREIHETIGEDAAILDPSEQLNEEAMYAIYEAKGEQLSLFTEDSEELVDLNEAEEMLRRLRTEDPSEFERIVELRDGIRSAMKSTAASGFVFCQAGRYQQLFLVNEDGKVISRDIPRVLAAIHCTAETERQTLPPGHNRRIMEAKRLFAEDVKHRDAERRHTTSLTHGQRYVLRELRPLFSAARDDERKARINTIEKVLRAPIPAAVNKELNRLRLNGVVGEPLLAELTRIYQQHSLHRLLEVQLPEMAAPATPRIICSEGFVE